jgi:hypothetical protein
VGAPSSKPKPMERPAGATLPPLSAAAGRERPTANTRASEAMRFCMGGLQQVACLAQVRARMRQRRPRGGETAVPRQNCHGAPGSPVGSVGQDPRVALRREARVPRRRRRLIVRKMLRRHGRGTAAIAPATDHHRSSASPKNTASQKARISAESGSHFDGEPATNPCARHGHCNGPPRKRRLCRPSLETS